MNPGKAVVIGACALVAACGSSSPCYVPVLRTNEPTRVLKSTTVSCPVAVAQTIVVKRPYGALRLDWDYISHSLFMRASNLSDQTTFGIEGVGVDPNFGSPLQAPRWAHLEYTHVKRFPHSAFDSSQPKPERFTIAIEPVLIAGPLSPDEIEFEYQAVRCTCKFYDSL
jgi:hypothetical protein